MNLSQIRQDTPGLQGQLFVNSAGASLMPTPVADRMVKAIVENQALGGYAADALRESEYEELQQELAQFLHCQPRNLAFATSATDAYGKALTSIPWQHGDVILTTQDDYVSNFLGFMALEKRFGIRYFRAPNLPNGDLDLNQFEALIKTHNPRLVAITQIPTSSGLVHPAIEVGKICQQYEILYLLDACQAVGQIHVDVQKIKCDFLTATGRKFMRGPRGTGFLYVSDKVLEMGLEPLTFDLRGAQWTAFDEYRTLPNARRFELWERAFPALLGLKEAVRYANRIGLDVIQTQNEALSRQLRKGLQAIPGLHLHDQGSRLCSIVTFTLEGLELARVAKLLKNEKVTFSVASQQSALIDFSHKGLKGAIRFSPHYFNSNEEINQILEIVQMIGKKR